MKNVVKNKKALKNVKMCHEWKSKKKIYIHAGGNYFCNKIWFTGYIEVSASECQSVTSEWFIDITLTNSI